ncbi:MAG: hypothetical protein LCH51_07900 [Bacteroidetes bacterium]|nr:hypothetical protein [Bacteroidota bacterium]
MSATQDTELSQLDKATHGIMSLDGRITRDDRRAAIIELGITGQTIRQYFIGRGRNLDTAVKLLQFFRKRIEDRDKLISA